MMPPVVTRVKMEGNIPLEEEEEEEKEEDKTILLEENETIDDINQGRKYKNMMDSRWNGGTYDKWLENIKIENSKLKYSDGTKKDYYDTTDYMYKVFDWHYKENKTALKYDKVEACARGFTSKEATTFKWRTLPKQFKDKGMIWLLMDVSYNKVGKIKSQKNTIDSLIEEVECLKEEVDTLKEKMELMDQKISLVIDKDLSGEIDIMKKQIKELQKYKDDREEADRNIEKEIYGI